MTHVLDSRLFSQVAQGVGQSIIVVLIEVERLGIAVDHARLLSQQKLALFHAHEAAVGAFGDGGGSKLHLTLFSHVSHKRWHVENFLVRHFVLLQVLFIQL